MILYFNFSKELCIHKEILYKGERIVISRNMSNYASNMLMFSSGLLLYSSIAVT